MESFKSFTLSSTVFPFIVWCVVIALGFASNHDIDPRLYGTGCAKGTGRYIAYKDLDTAKATLKDPWGNSYCAESIPDLPKADKH